MWKWLKNLFKRKRKKEKVQESKRDIPKDIPDDIPEYYKIALAEEGVKEIKGSRHEGRILEYHAAVKGSKARKDEIAWCASFVNWCMKEANCPMTNSRAARRFLKWGNPANVPVLGDVVVFYRGKKKGWQGHVAFFVAFDGKYVVVFGGNQSNKVCYKKYPIDKVLGYRTLRRA